MAKPLRDVAPKATKEGEYSGVKKSTTEPADISDWNASSGNNDFAKKHKIEKHADRVGNVDDVYGSGKVKAAPYKKQDQKVYESMKCESCGKSYEGESCGCNGKSVKAAVPGGGKGMIADKKKLDEVLTKKTPASEVISDFVHSKNKTFSGDSKKQRIKRALGAYYGMHKEEEQIDELKADTVGDYIKSASSSAANLKTDAAYANMTNDDARANKLRDKARNRQAGIYTAVNKLTGRAKVNANEELAMPMLEGGKKKKTQKESAPGDTPIRYTSGIADDPGRI